MLLIIGVSLATHLHVRVFGFFVAFILSVNFGSEIAGDGQIAAGLSYLRVPLGASDFSQNCKLPAYPENIPALIVLLFSVQLRR